MSGGPWPRVACHSAQITTSDAGATRERSRAGMEDREEEITCDPRVFLA